MTKPILSVIRIKTVPVFLPFDLSPYNDMEYTARHSDVECREFYAECIAWVTDHAGKYVKSGGAGFTNSIQQAQIFGWSRRAKEHIDDYRKYNIRHGDIHEIVPILITVA